VEEPEGGEPLSEAVCRRLEASRALLVLDNCEHVVDAAAEVAALLLSSCAGLAIVATSREPLLVDGELTWTVPAMTHQEAKQLFHQRAFAVRPEPQLDADDEEALVEICRRLDGLPLAIELAAARTRALSPRQIADGLERRFDLLSNGPRTGPGRHATLRASMDWSYELLGEEREVLRYLGVFAGGFDVEAIRDVHPAATIEQLAALVDRSLVLVEDAPERNRYRLLETVRSYALERLVAAGEHDEARSRHGDHYLALAEAAEPNFSGPQQQAWLSRLKADQDNLVAALTWTRDQGQSERLARLVVAMTPYWLERSQWSECEAWLNAAATGDDLPAGLHAQVLTCRCYLETWLGHWGVVPALASEALTLARGSGAKREEGRALGYLAVISALAMGADPARPYFEAATALARSTGDTWGVANLFTFFSLARLFQADPFESTRLLEEAMTLAHDRGDGRTLRLASAVAGLAAILQGRLEQAASLATHAVSDARTASHASALIVGLATEGWVDALRGAVDSAVSASGEAVVVARESGELRAFEALAMSVCGWALHVRGEREASLRTLGDASDLMRGSELPRWVGLPLVLLAEVQLDASDLSGARKSLEEASSVGTASGYPWILGRARQVQARLLAGDGDYEGAESHLHQAISLHKIAGDLVGWCDARRRRGLRGRRIPPPPGDKPAQDRRRSGGLVRRSRLVGGRVYRSRPSGCGAAPVGRRRCPASGPGNHCWSRKRFRS
jgi:predicted ATPase